MAVAAAPPPAVSLDDKYLLREGRIFLSGVQALVRVPLDQQRADHAAGLHTGTFISGYQGSPLGTFDQELLRIRGLWAEHELHLQPAVNEELGATAVWGSQLAAAIKGAKVDGVVGLWYGKNPGLDRAADAIRHANLCGVGPTGGAVALVGDDPGCKSSTLPSASEAMLASLLLPTLWPGNVQEVLDLGRHAVALSRASGLWTGFKIVTNVADAAGTAEVSPERVTPVIPEVLRSGRRYVHRPNPVMLAPDSLISERNLFDVRLEIARAYSRVNALNRVTVDGPGAWLGVAAAGKTYADLIQAFADLGLDELSLKAAGVRVLKLGMVWPLEEATVREWAQGLQELLVVEDKLPFLETAVKDVLYGVSEPPRVVGKRDEEGRVLLPAEGELDADLIASAIASRLRLRGIRVESVVARMAKIEEAHRAKLVPLPVVRTPFFCSGCPHNSSTVAADDALVGAGIGCHTMVLLNRDGRGMITGITQMGGEGAQWIGMSPFLEEQHFVQNLGDGTFHHSGSLAVRASVAAGTNVTYKLLANGSVAMTGAQRIQGGMSVAELTHWFALEGVKQVVVTTEDLARYDRVELSPIATVRPREHMLQVQKELAGVAGTTVLIHDQACAAENRRLRKRGKLEEPRKRAVINERVCEGCGDCGAKSSCLSVQPVETEFGRKTQIHQASCNKDFSCLEGDCPSFLTVIPGKAREHVIPAPPADLPEPEMLVDPTDFTLRMIGIGGTGVVTVSQILSMAAHLEGKHAWGLDQTGLSQKGGPVVSDVRLSTEPIAGANKASAAHVDLYLGLDLLGAANPRNLRTADPARTIAVVSTGAVPTGKMVVDPTVGFPALEDAFAAINGRTRAADNVFLDAQRLSERLFGDHLPANMIALGAAFQRGALPVAAGSIEAAIRLDATAVEKSLTAFAWGRACVAAPDAVAALEGVASRLVAEPVSAEGRALIARVGATAGSELRRLLELRVPELIAYQSAAYAARYVAFVGEVLQAERRLGGADDGALAITEAVARMHFKLLAYKDEYEVARLHLDALEKIRAEHGEEAELRFRLQPPVLRALGMHRKLELGEWFVPALGGLRRMKRLRGTRLDPFGRTAVRRVERALPAEYEEAVRGALAHLTPATSPLVAELAELPDVIRGYEEIKLRGVARWREETARLRARITEGVPTAPEAPFVLPFTLVHSGSS